MRIFLTGHGGWLPNDGFFTLPPKTHVVFYTLNAKLMLASDVYRLVGGTYLHPPAQIIEPYRSCQNLTLYPDDKDEINRTLSALMRNPDRDNCDVIRVNAPVKLKTIVTDYPGHEFVWACCRDLSLAATPGSIARNAGINAAQSGGTFTNFDKNTGTLNGPAYTLKWRVRVKRRMAF